MSQHQSQVRKGDGLPPLLKLLLPLLLTVPISAQTKSPDIVVINAKVRTMAGVNSIAEAIAVSGARVTAVGSYSHIRRLIGSNTQVIDARGRLLIPGFNDAHVHFMGIGNIYSTLDLRAINTSAQLESQISRYVQILPKGRWILGSGW